MKHKDAQKNAKHASRLYKQNDVLKGSSIASAYAMQQLLSSKKSALTGFKQMNKPCKVYVQVKWLCPILQSISQESMSQESISQDSILGDTFPCRDPNASCD